MPHQGLVGHFVVKALFALSVLVGFGAQSEIARAFEHQTYAGQPNVILLMLDGVRWQEFFYGADPKLAREGERGPAFPFVWQDMIRQGAVFGDRKRDKPMLASNGALLSLPAYHSIMAGRRQPCSNNSCGRIQVESLQERLVRELIIPKHQVATIASWKHIAEAAESTEGATFVNASVQPLDDGTYDPEIEEINRAQTKDLPPWGSARFDRYTYQHALRYLVKHRPRFMFISLNDSDEWAHMGDYPRYLESLRSYDQIIRQITSMLESMGEYGRNTTLIVTTDHGRGDGGSWRHHGWLWSASKYVWLYARGPRVASRVPFSEKSYEHVDIRPTIEELFGLRPAECKDCGRVMSELVVRRTSE